jgi:acetyltransferase
MAHTAATQQTALPAPHHLDPAHNILMSEHKPLQSFFEPQAVAVLGATDKPGSVGRTIFWNLIRTPFGGCVYPVNPKRSHVLGIQAYPSLEAIGRPIDLAIIVTPSNSVPALMQACAAHGVSSVIIISAGFKETGPAGQALEDEISAIATQAGIRIIGPNCLGLMNPKTGLNATFASAMARPGNIGFISQSGALCTAVLDWSLEQNVGFSKFISVGSMLDVDWGDLIYALGDDPDTDSILIYMETIGNARSFLSAAREIALVKPIIVIKPGRTQEAARAAASHTGSLAGSDDVLDAAFQRAGVLRVDSISELFSLADVLGKQPRPKGPHLTVITNAGGPGVLATDALIRHGGQLGQLSSTVVEKLNGFLPEAWSHNNPVDVLGDADPGRYAQAAQTVMQDVKTDGLLVILTPQAMTDPGATAAAMIPVLKDAPVPVLASWMGGPEVRAGDQRLNEAGIPTFAYPDEAAKTFAWMWQYSQRTRMLYETPRVLEDTVNIGARREAHQKVSEILAAARANSRLLLSEYEAKAVLSAYGMPTVETVLAHSEEEAVAIAQRLGYPVVLKLHSFVITHKSDIGGVLLNLASEAAVRDAYRAIREAALSHSSPGQEVAAFAGVTVQRMVRRSGTELILGATYDSQFGPVLLFGTGGTFVEVYRDKALALPPLNATLAQRFIEQTRVYQRLLGVRGEPGADMTALLDVVVRFSELVLAHPEICEVDINPLVASSQHLLALDARILLHAPNTAVVPPAIRAYPEAYVSQQALPSGKTVTLRPIRPEDEPLMRQFHRMLSEETVFQRYEAELSLDFRINHERLSRICFNDYDREIALIAIDDATQKIAGVTRLSKLPGQDSWATFRVMVADRYQGQGVGRVLITSMLAVARREGIQRIRTMVNRENASMLHLGQALGFAAMSDASAAYVTLDMGLSRES